LNSLEQLSASALGALALRSVGQRDRFRDLSQ
jgi:hypothetical protein